MATNQAIIGYDKLVDEVVITSPYYMRDICKGLKSRYWDKGTETWRVPASTASIEEVITKFEPTGADIRPAVYSALQVKRGRNTIFMRAKERTDFKSEDSPYDYIRPPMPHQVAGTYAMMQRDKVMLLDEMGLGKTKQIIDLACWRLKNGHINRVVVICPASLKWVWQDEIMKDAPEMYQDSLVLEGTRKKRDEQIKNIGRTPWLILNYELARIHPTPLFFLSQKQMLVCDEAHRIKNMKTKQSRVIHALEPKYIVLATGTPIANKPEDIFSLTQRVEPGLLGYNFWQFTDRYCVIVKSKDSNNKSKWIGGYKNLEDLRSRIDTVSVRRLKANVSDLKPKTYEQQIVTMAGDQLREYKRMKNQMVAQYKEVPESQFQLHAVNVQSQLLRLQQIANGYISLADRPPQWFKSNPKFAALDELVEDIVGSGQKIVLWSRFRAVTEMFVNRYAAYGSDRIFGDVPTKRRFELVEQFQKGKELNVLGLQIHTGGLGLTLTAAQTQVFIDRWWSPSVNIQAEDRLHRIGTKGTVVVIDIACKDSIDMYLAKMLKGKQQWSDTITGDTLRLNKQNTMALLGEEEVVDAVEPSIHG